MAGCMSPEIAWNPPDDKEGSRKSDIPREWCMVHGALCTIEHGAWLRRRGATRDTCRLTGGVQDARENAKPRWGTRMNQGNMVTHERVYGA